MDTFENLSSFLTQRLMSVAGEILEAFKETVCAYQGEIERITEENRCLRKALSETETDHNQAQQRAGCQSTYTDGVKNHSPNTASLDSEPSIIQVKLELATLKQECDPQTSLSGQYMCTADLTNSARDPEQAQNILDKTVNLDSGLHLDSAVSVKAEPLGYQAFSSGETNSGKALNELGNDLTGDEQDPLPCSHCDKTICDVAHLASPSHLQGQEILFSCEVCGKSFKKKGSLRTHMIVHQKERPVRCKLCGKSYSCVKVLNVHLISHTGERPFGCGYCEKRFKLKSHLKEHERIHTGEKPFSCPVCRRCFSRSNAVKIHIRNHHGQFQLPVDQ